MAFTEHNLFCFPAPFHGFAFWFDVEFNGPEIFPPHGDPSSTLNACSNGHVGDTTHRKKRANPNEALVLSTAPEDPPTHWQQVYSFFTIYCVLPITNAYNDTFLLEQNEAIAVSFMSLSSLPSLLILDFYNETNARLLCSFRSV